MFKKKAKQEPEMKEYIKGAGASLITKSLLNEETSLKWVFREDNEIGNGWVAFGESDTQEYVDNADNYAIIDFNTLTNIEPSVLNIVDMPYGSDLEFKNDATGKYFMDTQTGKEIREKVKSPIQIAFEENLKFLRNDTYSKEFLEELFQESQKTEVFTMGTIDFPTGEIIIADPLAYLYNDQYSKPLNRTIPIGKYPIILSICHSKVAGIRIAAAKLKVSSDSITKYEMAMPKGTTIKQLNESGIIAGFGVDAGVGSFCDVLIAKEYSDFLTKWHTENSGKNHYDDYFADFFQKSYEAFPNQQREGGDFIIWSVPETDHNLSMFSSGMGDGFYTGIWGLNNNDEVCELIIPFMNPDVF